MLKIQEFCKNRPENYEEILDKEFSIKTKKEDGLVLFKYNQIKSNFNNEMVRECRGIILEEGTWDVVCKKYEKFANYGESYAAEIDWDSAWVSSKEDGSLIALYYYKGEWHIATNGTINAFSADLATPFYAEEWDLMITTFGQLFLYTMSERYGVVNFNFLEGKEEFCHIFEICSPFNKIVVKYDKPTIFYISSVNNSTGEEKVFDMPTDKVRNYSLTSLEDCISLVSTFKEEQEGLVVCDKNFNRVKVKGDFYVHLHHLKSDSFTEARALSIIRAGEVEEVINYFPEFSTTITNIDLRYKDFIYKAKEYLKYLDGLSDEIKGNRKRFANQVKSSPYADLSFKWLDGRVDSIEEYYDKISSDKLIKMI